ncbi:MAG: DUF1553 domain-containing protein [Planctomycetota bacterium]
MRRRLALVTARSALLATAAAILAATTGAPAAAQPAGKPAQRGPVHPFEIAGELSEQNPIDACVLRALRARGIAPAHRCSDEVFIRRVFLDVIGTLPTPEEVRAFLADQRADKRAALIEKLFAREEFADYWALKWCDLLRVKAEFPINLWPNAVQGYHRWVRDALAQNRPYDQFARELLTASGSNFRVPPVNFYRAVQGREPAALARAAALTFMGVRIERWAQEQRRGFEAFFARVAFKSTAEWKEEIVLLNPAANEPLAAVFPDGQRVEVAVGVDPRRVFADWLIAPENPWFARNIVNRIWAWLLGCGIIHEPDDIGAHNPPAIPELLALLERELVVSKYDLRHVYRLILNSGTYQQSALARGEHADADQLFARYPVRRLDAEVLIDAFNQVFGGSEQYTSAIPEPFTFVPERQRTIALADGSISSPFLELFGRPPRDTGLESERDNRFTEGQALHLLNSSHIQKKIENSPHLSRLVQVAGPDRKRLVRSVYLRVLSRAPTEAELKAADEYLRTSGLPIRTAASDLAWALANSKEFLYRH